MAENTPNFSIDPDLAKLLEPGKLELRHLSEARSYLDMIEMLTDSSISGKHILDVGCGSSEQGDYGFRVYMPPAVPLMLAQEGARVLGIDPGRQDLDQLKYVRAKGGEILRLTLAQFQASLAENNANRQFIGVFDLVFTTDAFGWNPDPAVHDRFAAQEMFMAVCEQVLKPEGKALFDWRTDGEVDMLPDQHYSVWTKPKHPTSSTSGAVFTG